MKVGTIYENKKGIYKTYFTCIETFEDYGGPKVRGIELIIDNNNPKNSMIDLNAQYYMSELKDEIFFPEVGYIDIGKFLKNAILSGVKEDDRK